MNRDWTGDENGVFKIIGASNHANGERECNDYYATDPKAIDVLLREGNVKLNKDIWECACGEGHLSKRLIDYGYNVYSTDLVDRGYGIGGVDFLKQNETWHGDIVTNPPYKYAVEFVEHAIDIVEDDGRVAMFLKLQFLEGKKRKELFQKYPLETLYVSSSRIKCAINGDFAATESSAVAYGWYIFHKGYTGLPYIQWIN